MKTIKIKSCDDRCPYCKCVAEIPSFKCMKANRSLKKLSRIPDWCPLEDEAGFFASLSREESFIAETVIAARKIQTMLWGESNGSWGLEEWRRMFVKRYTKIEMIDPKNPHAIVEMKKRLLQNATLSIALTAILHFGRPLEIQNDKIPSNLPEYAGR